MSRKSTGRDPGLSEAISWRRSRMIFSECEWMTSQVFLNSALFAKRIQKPMNLYLKMRFLSYDYEILFSSWSITQGTIIRKKIIFFWQLAYVLICLNLYTTIHYKFTCVYKKYPSLPVLWHVIDELEMMEWVSDSLHDLFWHVVHPLDVRMSDPAITWRSIMTDNK